jgi:hypothetical protein
MDATSAPKVTVVQPGEGESVSIPGFGAVYKLYSRDNGGEVAIVEHPFACCRGGTMSFTDRREKGERAPGRRS